MEYKFSIYSFYHISVSDEINFDLSLLSLQLQIRDFYPWKRKCWYVTLMEIQNHFFTIHIWNGLATFCFDLFPGLKTDIFKKYF